MNKKWEYKIIALEKCDGIEEAEGILNKLGQEGWELQGATVVDLERCYIFKRLSSENFKLLDFLAFNSEDLSVRAKNVLKRLDVKTIGELCSIGESKLKHTANCGNLTYSEIKGIAEKYGTGLMNKEEK